MLVAVLFACRPLPVPEPPAAPAAEQTWSAARGPDGWQVIDGTGKPMSAERFDWIGRFDGYHAPVARGGTTPDGDWMHHGGRWGLVDRAGRVVIPVEHGGIGAIQDGLVPFMAGGEPGRHGRNEGSWGLMDLAGQVVVPAIPSTPSGEPRTWQALEPAGDGLWRVNSGGRPASWDLLLGGRWGLIDRTGAEVLPPSFGRLGSFSEGLAVARSQPSYDHPLDPAPPSGPCPGQDCPLLGYVNRTGSWVVAPSFQEASPFRDGRARVYDGFAYLHVDRTGSPVTARHRVIGHFGPEGLAMVHGEDGRRGFVNLAGDLVLTGYDEAEDFEEGRAHVDLDGHGFVDANGRWAVRAIYADADDFREGRAPVKVGGPVAPHSDDDRVGRWGFVDPYGSLAVPARYTEVQEFSCGRAAVAVFAPDPYGMPAYSAPRHWGFVDRDGREVISPTFDAVHPFACAASQGG